MAYLSPDVYIKEVSTGARPIEAVGTSTAGFVGQAIRRDAPKNEAVAVNNWGQFRAEFVGELGETPPASTPLVQAVWGFFQNGGSRCYVVNIGADKSLQKGLAALEQEDAIAIVAAPGYTEAGHYDELLTHCENMGDRVAILDGPSRVTKVSELTQVAEGGTPADAAAAGKGKGARRSKRGFGAFYYPWIRMRDPLRTAEEVEAPPSGHLAGIYARTDATRGVHKAPANETVRGALGVTHRLTRGDQDELNPEGVNCIRFFSNEGVLVWGARTVAPASDPEWRYVSVRRLFNMVEESIAKSTRWVVFEPNDPSLWKAISRDVGAFLTLLWRDGMLLGSTPEEAFFVKCDAETNTKEVIDAGRVVIQVGLAPVKPAEFVIFEIGQHAGGTDVAAEGAE
ncbi:MAG: phage tail sheath family protein [Planctomycetota bacterium]